MKILDTTMAHVSVMGVATIAGDTATDTDTTTMTTIDRTHLQCILAFNWTRQTNEVRGDTALAVKVNRISHECLQVSPD